MKIPKTALNLSKEEKEILNEVVNIGFGHSTNALGQLLNKKIELFWPDIGILKKKDIYNVFSINDIYVGVHMQVLEDLEGILVCLFKKEEAINLIKEISGKDLSILDDQGISVIKEVCNILSGAYISSLAEFSNMRLLPSLPHLALDNAASILDFLTNNLGYEDFEFLFVNNNLHIKDSNLKIEASLILILNPGDLQKMFTALKEKYKSHN